MSRTRFTGRSHFSSKIRPSCEIPLLGQTTTEFGQMGLSASWEGLSAALLAVAMVAWGRSHAIEELRPYLSLGLGHPYPLGSQLRSRRLSFSSEVSETADPKAQGTAPSYPGQRPSGHTGVFNKTQTSKEPHCHTLKKA